MQPGALLASLGLALSPMSRRCLASCGRPLAVLAVLAVGATVFGAAASLLGTRQPAALFHAATEAVAGQPGPLPVHALPLPLPSGPGTAAVDLALAGLKGGPADGASGAPRPSPFIDGERPPLRIDIMGLDHLPRPGSSPLVVKLP